LYLGLTSCFSHQNRAVRKAVHEFALICRSIAPNVGAEAVWFSLGELAVIAPGCLVLNHAASRGNTILKLTDIDAAPGAYQNPETIWLAGEVIAFVFLSVLSGVDANSMRLAVFELAFVSIACRVDQNTLAFIFAIIKAPG
jgi:hypothetical protein